MLQGDTPFQMPGTQPALQQEALSVEEICRFLKNKGIQIELHKEIGSTNTRAKELAAAGAPHGTLVLAESQTHGRGRFDRRFYSPEGSGLYMSVILRLDIPAQQAVQVTAYTAVAAARAIESLCPLQVQIKWVNDLYINGRKLAGILAESGLDMQSGRLEYCVVGIGINVGEAAYPEELRNIAVSVEEACGSRISRNALAAGITDRLFDAAQEIQASSFMQEYIERSAIIGKRVTVLRGEECFEATVVNIDREGGLEVETHSGLQTLHSGEVSLKLQGR